ncbi:MAG: SUMF1/EgtB/PvdO family nonheme iron enzyme, partial [Anaerolineales bacterium]|nr:SUMF1/EgtB/PvdO family nonheme iron enzyme [Anaerolineales bacterium]
MNQMVRDALARAGAPKEDEALLAWFKRAGLDRLKERSDYPLNRQLARAVLRFTEPKKSPPDDLIISLNWPLENRAALSQLLYHLNKGLESIEGWQALIAYVKVAEEKNLLDEILEYLADFENLFVRTRAGQALKVAVVQKGLSPQEATEIERTYRQGLIHEYRKHTVTGIAQIKRMVRLPLKDIYLEPNLLPLGTPPEDGHADIQFQQSKVPLSKVIPLAQRLLIAGKPGSGKTITLKFIALMFALGQPGANRLGYQLPYIPLLVRLADYAVALKKSPDLALETFLLDYIEKYYPGAPQQGEFLRLALQNGACIVLLDGLDEVGDIDETDIRGQALRNQVLKQVQRFGARRCTSPNTNRLILTSRLEGYYLGSLPEFLEVELCGLESLEEIEAFLLRWFMAYEIETEPDLSFPVALRRVRHERIDQLIPVIERWESIRRLAVNPLLLTILTIIHETGKRLPHHRVELYETVIKTMIESWRQAQTDHVSNLYSALQTNDVYYLMASLAYWLHENQPGGTIREFEWQQKIEELLGQDGYKDDNDLLARRFLRHAREETGLLTERSPGQIGFFHLTLEEYLAAVEMARRETDERTQMLEKHWADPRWQETILLAAGVLNIRGSKIAHKNFITNLLWMEPTVPELLGRPAVLAGKALIDLNPRKFAHTTYQSVLQNLKDVMQDNIPATGLPDPQGQIPTLTRAEAADVLDQLGWLPPDLHEFVFIPTPNHIADNAEELPLYLLKSKGFYLGKYPVTNAQYQRFLEADDFADPELWMNFPKFDELSAPMGNHWGDTGWQWYRNYQMHRLNDPDGKIYPAFWHDPHFGYEHKGLPVVGLSWFETNAYCLWLKKHWQDPLVAEGQVNSLGQPKEIRLPTEVEWLIAAGGATNPERFPWDRADRITRYEYDHAARLVKVARPGDSTTNPSLQYVYTLNTSNTPLRIDKILLPNGGTTLRQQTVQFINGLGQVVQNNQVGMNMSDYGLGDVATFTSYDALGRQTCQSSPLPFANNSGYIATTTCEDSTTPHTTTHYDYRGKVDLVTYPDGTTTSTTYSIPGSWATTVGRGLQQDWIQNANGDITLNTYDAFGRLDWVGQKDNGGPCSALQVTTYDYDTAGNLQDVWRGGNVCGSTYTPGTVNSH